MNLKLPLLIAGLFLGLALNAQKNTLSGYIRDADNGETLIGATIAVRGTSIGTVTNEYGFYSLSLDPGAYDLLVSYIGFADLPINVDLSSSNQQLDLELSVEGTQLAEVVVSATEENSNISDLQMSVQQLNMSTIQKLPTLLGETDVLRSIQLLPGVTTVGEGAAGFNVRGGSIDQNLVILDEAPVYNSSHLFGFFSVFNPDAVKSVKLYKGGIPARFGGRLSSILDVRMREGNSKQFQAQGGIGTIFSRLAIEAPIVKDKGSFLLAGRRSYIDVLAGPFLSDDLGDTKLNFYDLTLKTNMKVGEKDQLFLSGYLGRDVFQFGAAAGFNWGNRTATLRWNHLFNDRLFSNFTAYYSNYDYEIAFGDDDDNSFDWNARIINASVKPEFSYFLNPDNVWRFGGQAIFYEFQPANAVSVNVGEEIDFSLDKQFAVESSLFLENELKIGNNLQLNYGLRMSHFAYLGNRNVYTYGEAPEVGLERPLTDVTFFAQGETVEDWINLEPRFALQYQLSPRSSIKASYNRTAQYIHLLSNTTASVPLDIWTPSTNNIEPQMADQVALGYFQNFSDNEYEFSAEVYYKDLQNLVDYIDGADLILNEFVEGQVLQGDGRAYGLELMMKKTEGRFSGWVNYTLARTERQIAGINNGDWYPSRFDQTHNFSITGFYELSQRATLSASFVYNTGTPTTLPSSGYYQQGIYIPNNDGDARNNFRIPDYHRLDISLTLDRNPNKPAKRWEGQWVFGIYNVYGRRNAFSIYGQQQEQRPIPGVLTDAEAIRFSVVGSLIPSISYNFKFQ
ncbi:MAG: TonB-dependent receptor [Bacteroidota bacterium]